MTFFGVESVVVIRGQAFRKRGLFNRGIVMSIAGIQKRRHSSCHNR